MTDRSRQRIAAPEPILRDETENERLRVLRCIARELPALAARRNIRMVGKGGTALALADGLPRPSNDYDVDTDQPISKPALARLVSQALARAPGIRDAKCEWSGRRNDPVEFEWDTSDKRIHADSFINSTVRTCATQRPRTWNLSGPSIEDEAVRTVDGVTVYTTTELVRGKASAFMGRAKARDTYDIAWALAVRLDAVDSVTRIALDEFMARGVTDHQWEGWATDYEDDRIMKRSSMDPVMETIMECLEKDPVVRVAREPRRGLGFWIDATAGTVALVLPQTDEGHEREELFCAPRGAIEEIAKFIVDSRADLSHTLNLGPADIAREGTGGVTRIIENGVGSFERSQGKGWAR